MNLNLRWSRRRHLHETASPRRRFPDHTRVYACREQTFRSPQGQLAKALVRPFKIDQEPLDARLLASTVGVDHNAAPDTIGYSTRDLTHGLDLSKMLIETLHGTMNVSKHFFLALYAVFLSLDLSKGLLGVLRKHGVDFFLRARDENGRGRRRHDRRHYLYVAEDADERPVCRPNHLPGEAVVCGERHRGLLR